MAPGKPAPSPRTRPRTRAKDALAAYHARRDFAITPEPSGKTGGKPGKGARGRSLRFMVQHHWATRDHFDFRLELDGVLKSWAVTRGPSANPATKRLAVRTEDHPLSYADFEGVIPPKQYGAGTVMLWDDGLWESLDDDPARAIEKGSLKFRLKGQRMQGEWALVRLKPRSSKDKESWLLIKHRDAFAEADDSLATRFDTSIASGRTREELAQGGAVYRTMKEAALPLPAFVPPALCRLVEHAPEGGEWLHEIKYDGYRLELLIAGHETRLMTRNGLDWTDRFPAIADAARRLAVGDAIIDGEAVVLDRHGLSDFGCLVGALESGKGDIVLMAFDLLRLDGEDMRALPLLRRKQRLKRILDEAGLDALRYSDHVEGQGPQVFARAVEGGAEGIICKRADRPYPAGRTGDWVKVKGDKRVDVFIVGWLPSERGRAFASLATADDSGGTLRYTGGVGTGFNERKQKQILALLKPLARDTPPEILAHKERAPRGLRWVEPRRVIEVRFAGWTPDGQLRQARFLALREEEAVPQASGQSRQAASSSALTRPEAPAKAREPASIMKRKGAAQGFRITHPERIVYPRDGITKQDVADYYASIAPALLPFIANRPVSLIRAPDGIAAETFFQRHPMKGMGQGKGIVPVKLEKRTYMALDGLDGLMAAAQFGAVEIHGWGARADRLDRPDRIVFDLDPHEDVPFAAVREAALEIRDLLGAAGLAGFPLLSGGKGIHVVLPLAPRNSWEEVEAFTSGFAKRLAASDPARYVAVMTKAKRKGRIFIDWLRNTRLATAIVPFSLRARDGAPVAVPVTWTDLPRMAAANAFRMRDVTPAMAEAWPDYFGMKQSISRALLDTLKG